MPWVSEGEMGWDLCSLADALPLAFVAMGLALVVKHLVVRQA